MERTNATYFFDELFQRNIAAFTGGGDVVATRHGNRFINNIATTFPMGTMGALTNYTQSLQNDNEWKNPHNHQFLRSGIVQYFCEKPEFYTLFTIIKHAMTTNQFITQEQQEQMTTITNNPQSVRHIIMYLLNMQLYRIYDNWRANKSRCKDAAMLHTRLGQIHTSHNIPSNMPDISQIAYNEQLLEPLQNWRVIISSPVISDNYAAYNEMWSFLKEYSDMIHGYSAPPTPSVVATTPLPIEKKKKKPIPVALKRKVWSKWVGEDVGKAKCLCCQLTDITQLSFHCGHIVAEAAGGELKVDNLKPICQSCNSSMGTTNMDDFTKKYGF